MNFEIRTTGHPLKLVGTMVRVIHDFDRNLTPSDVQTQAQEIDQSLVQERLFAKLTSFFSVLALSLACLGLYGTLAYAVTRRTNEIGIRMALGGERGSILTMLMQETLAMVVAGVAAGIPMALAATRLVASMLFGLKPTDLLTLVLATAVMLTAATLAGYLPARRASQVDPMVGLRYELGTVLPGAGASWSVPLDSVCRSRYGLLVQTPLFSRFKLSSSNSTPRRRGRFCLATLQEVIVVCLSQ